VNPAPSGHPVFGSLLCAFLSVSAGSRIPARDGYSAREAETLFARLPEQLSQVSGVRSVALAGSAPFGGLLVHTQHGRLSALPRDGDGRPVWCQCLREQIGANYFATLGVPLVSGHEFDIRDQQSDAPLLASIGLGGVTAFAVAQRRKEIGIRMALGARGGQVRGLVMREGTALVVMGTVCGFGGALALRRAFSALSETLAKGFAQPACWPLWPCSPATSARGVTRQSGTDDRFLSSVNYSCFGKA
jgi:hypothetical protein